MVSERDHYFQSGQARIHAHGWHTGPAGEPPLLILHGIWESWRTFDTVAPTLAHRRDVYGLDLRGHGDSGRPDTGYRLVDYAADVVAVIDQLGTERVELLGHSLGGLVALQVAGMTPEQVCHLVLEDPAIVLPEETDLVRDQFREMLALKHEPLEVVREMMDLTHPPEFGETWIDAITRSLVATADGPFLGLIQNDLMAELEVVAPITVPTLALAADPLEGGWLTRRRQETLRLLVPQVRILDIPESSHHIQTSFPEVYVQAIEGFLGAPPAEHLL